MISLRIANSFFNFVEQINFPNIAYYSRKNWKNWILWHFITYVYLYFLAFWFFILTYLINFFLINFLIFYFFYAYIYYTFIQTRKRNFYIIFSNFHVFFFYVEHCCYLSCAKFKNFMFLVVKTIVFVCFFLTL